MRSIDSPAKVRRSGIHNSINVGIH
jgi:hypothetical protein